MKTFRFALGLILTAALFVYAQEEEEEEESPVGSVAVDSGIMVYSNIGNDFFTFEIFGKPITTFNKNGNNFVNVNGRGVQYNIVTVREFMSAEEIKTKSDSVILRKHATFESAFMEENLKQRLDVKTEMKKRKDGGRFLVWSFKMPKRSGNVAMQLFLTTVVGNHVLVLNGIIVKEEDYREIYRLLEKTLNSIRVRATPFDPEASRDSSGAPDKDPE